MSSPAEGSRRLLSIAAAARILGISQRGVRRLIRARQLPTVEVGDAARIPMQAIDQLVRARDESGDAGGRVEDLSRDIPGMLDELRVGQAQLLEEVARLSHEVADLTRERKPEVSDEPLLTVKDVADLLRVSHGVVYGWSGGTDGPPVTRVGRSLRFYRRDVLAWLDANRQEATNSYLEARSNRTQKAGGLREAQLRADRPKADAPGLLDNIALAVILDIPVATVDGWRSTGRGPRWARIGGVVRYRVDDVRGWLLAERELQENRSDRRYRRIDCDAAFERLETRVPSAPPR